MAQFGQQIPPALSMRNRASFGWSDDHEEHSLPHGLGRADLDRDYCSTVFAQYWNLHFHRLEHEEYIAFVDACPWGGVDSENRCVHFTVHATRHRRI